jgi:hypothetical protein
MSSFTFNITTTQSSIDIKSLFNSNAIMVVNDDADNNVFYNPNPNGSVVLTADTAVTISAASGNIYSCADTSSLAVDDKVKIYNGSTYFICDVVAVVPNTSFTIAAKSGLTPAGTDVITAIPHKLLNGTSLKSSQFTNGLKVKHKDNTGTGEYQISFVEVDTLAPVSPFFFKG